MEVQEEERVTVCPYCGVPNRCDKAICAACGNDLEPNRVVFDPISCAWQVGRGISRRPVEREPRVWLVRGGLLVIGLTFLTPSLFSIVAELRGLMSGHDSFGMQAVILSVLWALVGGILCCRALRKGKPH
jgi:hypothetical protein